MQKHNPTIIRPWREQARRLGLLIGVVPIALALVVALVSDHFGVGTPGPMNAGHEDVDCDGCHLPAPGETRQQFQAAVRWHLDRRAAPAWVATLPVDNHACLGCHEREDDRHPVYRFNEPRFEDARAAIGADRCVSCHREHQGVRITAEPTICSNCHEDTRLREDPLDVSHVELIADARWDTCLGCHDFHGNHPHTPPASLTDALAPAQIEAYFAGGPSIYAEPKRHVAPRTRP